MDQTEGSGFGQRVLAHYQTRLQHGAGRVPGLVPAGAATGFRQGYRQRVAGSQMALGSARGEEVIPGETGLNV